MTINDAGPCGSCGGRGWKFLTYRRSHERSGGAAELSPVMRERVACLFCQYRSGHAHHATPSEGD